MENIQRTESCDFREKYSLPRVVAVQCTPDC